MLERSPIDVLLTDGKEWFGFLTKEYGYELVEELRRPSMDPQYPRNESALLVWQTADRRVTVDAGRGTEINVFAGTAQASLEKILNVCRFRRTHVPPGPSLGWEYRLYAERLQQYGRPWLEGDTAAFAEVAIYCDIEGKWRRDLIPNGYPEQALRRPHEKASSPRSFKQYRQLKRRWEQHEYQAFIALVEGLPKPWTEAETTMLEYAKARLISDPYATAPVEPSGD